MNNYYFDSSFDAGGDGSKEKPFSTISEFFALSSVEHPLTLNLKRGSVFVGNFEDTNKIMFNQSSDISYITDYGDESLGDPVITRSDSSNLAFCLRKARNLTIKENIVFLHDNNTTLIRIAPCGLSNTDRTANVWFKAKVIGASGSIPGYRGDSGTEYAMFMQQNPQDGTSNLVGDFWGLDGARFENIIRGCWLLGMGGGSNGGMQDFSSQSKAVQVKNSTFNRVGMDFCVISGVSSNLDPKNDGVDDYTSGIWGCRGSGLTFAGQKTYSVAFWWTACYGLHVHDNTVIGIGPSKTDRQPFDFDVRSWNCLVEDNYSANCGGGVLLAVTFASQVTAKPDSETVDSWYVTKMFGNGNNTFRNHRSFNDGIDKYKISIQGYIYNLVIENLMFIDTTSTKVSIANVNSQNYPQSSDQNWGAKINGCKFFLSNVSEYARYWDTSSSANTEFMSNFKGCDFYFNGVSPVTMPSNSDGGNNNINKFLSLFPKSNPSTIDGFDSFFK